MRVFSAAFLAASLASCSVAGERISASRAALSGAVVAPDAGFSVAVITSGGDLCSGVLLTPGLVATARHCVARPTDDSLCEGSRFGEADSPIALFVTSSPDVASAKSAWSRVRGILIPDTSAYCGGDLALLVLADPIAGAVVAQPALGGEALPATVSLVGYGAIGPRAGADDGVRRARDVPVICAPGAACGAVVAAGEFVTGEGPCPGDSGAGAFDLTGPTPVAHGVLSRGRVSREACETGIFTPLAGHAALVKRAAHVAALSLGIAAPAWAGERPADASPLVTPEQASHELGAECTYDAACASGVCAPSLMGNDAVCASRCGANAPCPSAFECRGYGPVGMCFRAPSPLSEVPEAEGAPPSCASSPAMSGAGASLQGAVLLAATFLAARSVGAWRRRKKPC